MDRDPRDPKRRKVDNAAPGGALVSASFKAPPSPSLSSHSSTDRSFGVLYPAVGSSPGTTTSAISRFTARSRSSLLPGDPITIEGYSNAQVISVHYDDIVAVRALSTTRGDRRVLLKLSLSASPNAAAQFKAEAGLLDALREQGIHNVSKIIARESGRLGAIIIAEDEGTRFFHEVYLKDRAPGPHWTDPAHLLRTVEITIKLVHLLSSIHNLSIVHGSLRPTTISASVFAEPHLHDFSAAFRVGPDGDSNPIRERGMHEASLPYLAPECSGRIGRHADYRSDYYGLGAVLFQILTGRVPFADCGPDPLEIIHAHITKRPPLASTLDESIPLPLAKVVAKLLEKAPEARYQTSQGLIVDLEKITAMIRGTSWSPSHLGPIDDDAFIVGSVDKAAYFRLPPASRLFGREASVHALLACYRRVETDHTSEVVVVTGVSGIGKTSLVETVRKPVVQAKGFFTSVKFDQVKSPVPLFAISQALSGLLRQLLAESEPHLVVWRRRISKVLSDEGRILADVLPALENIFEAGWVDTLPPIVPLEPNESEARLRGIVQRVLRAFARAGHPLVIMFDDLQWSTSSDLAFIVSLLASDDKASTSPSSLLVLCVWRDNEVTPDHIVNTVLLPRLPEVKLYIKLEPLGLADVAAFVSESLRKPRVLPGETPAPERDDANLRGLSELICRKTGGSPLFVAQLLKALNADGFFSFDFTVGCWVYDVERIASQSLSTDIVDLLRTTMQKFSPLGQEYLMVAACIGNEEISTRTLSQATARSFVEVAQGMQEAVQKGLILPFGALEAEVTPPPRPQTTLASLSTPTVPAFYRFFHDRCQQAAYSLASPSEVSAMHYRIGQNLVSNTNEEDLLDRIFDLANQLNHGIGIQRSMVERDRLARFNYLAGRKANKSTAFEAARTYLSIAWDLLGSGSWEGQHGLMCEICEELVEVESSLADYAASQEYVQLFLAHAKDPVRRLSVYARSLRSATATGDSTRAIAIGREGLAMVGIQLPDDAAAGEALQREVRDEVGTDTLITALSSVRLTDPLAAGAQAILAALVAPVYFTRIDLLGPLASLAVRGAFRNGLDDAGAMMLTLYAVIIHGKHKEFSRGHVLGQIATAFFERNGGSPFASPTYKIYASHIAVWSDPVRDTFPAFRQAIAYAISYRDGSYLGFGSGELCSYSILCGVSLDEITSSLETFSLLVRKFRNELSTLYIAVVHQSALNFAGHSVHPCDIEGEAFSLADKRIVDEKHYAIIQLTLHMFELMLACFFNDSQRAKDAIMLGRPALPGGAGILYPAMFQLFEAVMLFDDPSALTDADRVVLRDTMTLFDELAQLQKSNFEHMRLWLKAEEARSRGDMKPALEFYDQAIEAATDARFIHFAACCNERAAAILTNPKLAAGYIFDAHAQWKKWGCAPKVTEIEARHPKLFGGWAHRPATTGLGLSDLPSTGPTSEAYVVEGESPSVRDGHTPLQRAWLNSPVLRHRRSACSSGSGEVASSDIRSEPRSGSDSHPRSHLATELDLRTVVSASSVLGQETSVDGVVSKLLGLALRTAGAELGLLVLNKQGLLCAEAIARSDSTEVKHLHRLDSIETQPDRYPVSVINYVARSREMVVNDLDAVGEAISDPYLTKHRPNSILCLALVSQSQVVGVLYMENSQTMNAFTPDRLEILSLISGQAASTVEKARLVHDLKSANEDLKCSQATLEGYNRNLEGVVNSRTIELRDQNTRLEAEITEKELAQAQMRSAKEVAESATAMKSQFLANMSHEIRTPFNAVLSLTGLLLDTSLDPLQMDYVETIKNSSHELLVVINDILDYSKIELDHLELSPEKVQLRNALEASMDMVAERAAAKSVELALVLEQGDIDIYTDLTRLRQVVVNLLSNAVKFTSNGEVTVTCSAQRLEPTPAGEQLSRVRISVKDSGIGIAESDFSKLFRVFSQVDGSKTTKLFGGTGLGLAISRKLSILLGGDITVQSVVGNGSTFTLEFVAPSAPPPPTDPYTPLQNPDLAGKRCLIIDTNETSRNVLKSLILSFGMAPEAPDITMAFQVAVDASEAGRPFDLFIIDSFIPGFAAQTLLRRLRQRGFSTSTIALTRMGSPIHDALRHLDCTALIKPIKRNRLHHTLRQVFPAGELSRKSTTDLPGPASPFPTNLASRNPLVLLCAEDNPINVKVITHLLKRMGYTTDIAEDGVVAVEKAQKKRFDLIFMDVNMPRMNGLEATRRIVELFPDKALRPHIVAMTANCMSDDKQKCLQAGCDDYVSKPILVPDLVAALNEAGVKARSRSPRRPTTANSESAPPFELGLPPRPRGARKSLPAPGTSDSSPSRSPVPSPPA